MSAVAARALAAVDVPIIAVQHDVLSEVVRETGSARTRVLMPLLVRMIYPLAERAVAVSEGAALDLSIIAGIPQDEIDVIPTLTVTPDIIDRAAEPTQCPWLVSKTAPVSPAVGNLRPVKDHVMLIRAFARLRAVRSAKLVILGEGEERPKLEQLTRQLGIEQDVLMPGHDPNPYAAMARADVLALSSRHEGFGNVLVEAMACGCPAIATD